MAFSLGRVCGSFCEYMFKRINSTNTHVFLYISSVNNDDAMLLLIMSIVTSLLGAFVNDVRE